MGDKCCQRRRHGISLSKRHGGALRSQSREAAGPVVRRLEVPGGAPGPWGRGLTKDTPRFSKSRFPQGTWTSIAVLFNPRMGLHRDIQNMPGHSNHALALGDYIEGRVWIEDDEGDSTAWLDDKKGGESYEADGWTCTTSPSASMLAAIIRWSHTRATSFPLPEK